MIIFKQSWSILHIRPDMPRQLHLHVLMAHAQNLSWHYVYLGMHDNMCSTRESLGLVSRHTIVRCYSNRGFYFIFVLFLSVSTPQAAVKPRSSMPSPQREWCTRLPEPAARES